MKDQKVSSVLVLLFFCLAKKEKDDHPVKRHGLLLPGHPGGVSEVYCGAVAGGGQQLGAGERERLRAPSAT